MGASLDLDHKHLKELEAQLEVEMRCKNQAYFFILEKGLLWQFRDFCRGYHGDPFQDCRKHIASNWQSYISHLHK